MCMGFSSHCSSTTSVVKTTTAAATGNRAFYDPPGRSRRTQYLVCLFSDEPAPTLSERARKRVASKKRKLAQAHTDNSQQLLTKRAIKQAEHQARMAAQEPV